MSSKTNTNGTEVMVLLMTELEGLAGSKNTCTLHLQTANVLIGSQRTDLGNLFECRNSEEIASLHFGLQKSFRCSCG